MAALKCALTWASIAAYAIAAWLWYRSTVVKVSAKEVEEREGKDGWYPAQIIDDDDSDFVESAKLQARCSRKAAFVTGVALAIQAVATAL